MSLQDVVKPVELLEVGLPWGDRASEDRDTQPADAPSREYSGSITWPPEESDQELNDWRAAF